MTNDNYSTSRTYDKRGHLLACVQSHAFSAICIILGVFALLAIVALVTLIVAISAQKLWDAPLTPVIVIVATLGTLALIPPTVGAWYMQHFAEDADDFFKGLAAFRVVPVLFILAGLALLAIAPMGTELYRDYAVARLKAGQTLSDGAYAALTLSLIGTMLTGACLALASFFSLLYTILLPARAAGHSAGATVVKNISMVLLLALIPVGLFATLTSWIFGTITNLVGVGFVLLGIVALLPMAVFLLALASFLHKLDAGFPKKS